MKSAQHEICIVLQQQRHAAKNSGPLAAHNHVFIVLAKSMSSPKCNSGYACLQSSKMTNIRLMLGTPNLPPPNGLSIDFGQGFQHTF